MISPRSLCVFCFSLVIAAVWPHRLVAEQPNPAPTSPPPVTAPPPEPVPPTAPPSPSAPQQPTPTNLAPTQAAPTPRGSGTVAPAEPIPAKIAPIDPTAAKTERAITPTSDALTPARLMAGPSIFETGRVGKMAVSGAQIPKTRADHGILQEPLVPQPVGPAERPAQPPSGVINQAVLGREIKSRFAALGTCRTEVARHGKIAPMSGPKHRLMLRWTILPSGRITDATVIATARVNLRVMDCVKRHMTAWTFSAPRGGSVRVERPLTFGASR